ncbi:MAG: glycosyltransferase family 2 protein [Verrucomicrobia bacterium]|nr:glycosyltransferase family 2 protein [Verrucomicrobiota bacterium]
MKNKVSILVLVYGPHHELARRCLKSILQNLNPKDYQLIVGANQPCQETREFLHSIRDSIDVLIESSVNLYKSPMMSRMLEVADGDLIWWFDDDSHIKSPEALTWWTDCVAISGPEVVQWGDIWYVENPTPLAGAASLQEFVIGSPWFRGLPPPSETVGGKGVTEFNGKPGGDPRWFFATGGCWMARHDSLKYLNWPDPRLVIEFEDVILGEAIRQAGWVTRHVGQLGVHINDCSRRWTESVAHEFALSRIHTS